MDVLDNLITRVANFYKAGYREDLNFHLTKRFGCFPNGWNEILETSE